MCTSRWFIFESSMTVYYSVNVSLVVFDWLLFTRLLPPKSNWDCYEKNHGFDYAICFDKRDRQITHDLTKVWYGISGYFAVFSVFPQWEQNRSFVYFSRNKHKQADRFVLKPHGKEKLEMLFYRFAATILFFLSCPSPRCLTARHLIEGLAVSYQ